ncbi:MAG: NmrA/HSCARG family protein [Longimicrobiales bacterium]
MSDKKIIAIVGATGAQGGGLARAILSDSDSEFAVRALTRNPDSDAARALADAGAEVVQADLSDVDSLRKAFAGAYGAFCLTNFWEHFSPDTEQAQARNLATAAADAGLQHVIWSTLEDTRKRVPLDDDRMPTLQERFKVPHFDAKGEADAYFADAGVPTTYLLTAFYWDNLIHFGMHPQRDEDGRLVLSLPMEDARLSGIAAEDIGKCAYGVFQAGDEYVGRYVGIAGGHLTGQEMADALSDALGEPVAYHAVPFDVYRGLGFPGADDLGNMFQYYCEFEAEFVDARPVDRSRALNPELQSFEGWLEANADRLPIDGK